MRTTTRAVVIGGGIAGCSAIYHLTCEGWNDVMLLERDELTSGTTWHSAAQVTNFGGNQTMIGLKSHSIKLYQELANDPDYPINYHHGDGGLRLASENWHLDGYKHFQSMAKGMGVEFELLNATEAARRHPLITTDGLMGALWDPMDGDIDPAQLCQALARRARKAGAEIHRHTPVTALRQLPDDTWIVTTDKGEIHAEHVVNAGGYRCNEIGEMMDVTLPVVSMEHQYFLTEPLQGIIDAGHRMPLLRCPTDDFYSRQEKEGLLVGFYEQECKTWGLDGIDPNFTMALSPDDPDRVLPVLENVFKRMPALMETGIHTIVNGPITYTPDGLPLVGRIPGKRNAWCITGLRAGLGEGGGHGWLLAQEMVHGQACYDTWCLDPRRFSQRADIPYTTAKVIEDYQNEFRFHRPHEFRPAGRDLRPSPLHETHQKQGAEFGVVNGWERPLFYKTEADFQPDHSFHFSNVDPVVEAEVQHIHNHVGIAEVNGFNRIEITGTGVMEWLDGLICGRLPKKLGKVGLGYFLTKTGDVLGEATIARLSENRVWWGSAAAAQDHDLDWLNGQNPPEGIALTSRVESHTIILIAGPKSRQMLTKACPDQSWERTDFPWLSVKECQIAGIDATVMSVSFSGELAYEIHVAIDQSKALYAALSLAGEDFNLRPFGMFAVESMRIEKGYRHWKADLFNEFDPIESDLARFVKLDKSDCIGVTALAAKGGKKRRAFVTIKISSDFAPAHGGDSVMHEDNVIGTVTSAAYGHRVGENLAMAFVDVEHAAIGHELTLWVQGKMLPGTVVEPCRFDPENQNMRS